MERRIRLRPGFQRKLIEEAKNKAEMTWQKLAGHTEFSKSYLKVDLRYERVLLPEGLFKFLCEFVNKDYGKYVLDRLDSNWGQVKGGQKGGRVSRPKPVNYLVNSQSAELAEIMGIMIGDGNSCVHPGYYYVRITGHEVDDKDYLLNHVKGLFSRVFGIELNHYFHRSRRELFLSKGSKDLVYTLEKYGFPPGNKKRNNVGIPDWIMKEPEFLRPCIRGLIDTDGSVSPITGRAYPYIWFKSSIPKLRKTFASAMNKLNFQIGKWTGKGTPQTYIAKKTLVERYQQEIGFNNPKHNNRFEDFMRPR